MHCLPHGFLPFRLYILLGSPLPCTCKNTACVSIAWFTATVILHIPGFWVSPVLPRLDTAADYRSLHLGFCFMPATRDSLRNLATLCRTLDGFYTCHRFTTAVHLLQWNYSRYRFSAVSLLTWTFWFLDTACLCLPGSCCSPALYGTCRSTLHLPLPFYAVLPPAAFLRYRVPAARLHYT